jgi:hypothetical protein
MLPISHPGNAINRSGGVSKVNLLLKKCIGTAIVVDCDGSKRYMSDIDDFTASNHPVFKHIKIPAGYPGSHECKLKLSTQNDATITYCDTHYCSSTCNWCLGFAPEEGRIVRAAMVIYIFVDVVFHMPTGMTDTIFEHLSLTVHNLEVVLLVPVIGERDGGYAAKNEEGHQVMSENKIRFVDTSSFDPVDWESSAANLMNLFKRRHSLRFDCHSIGCIGSYLVFHLTHLNMGSVLKVNQPERVGRMMAIDKAELEGSPHKMKKNKVLIYMTQEAINMISRSVIVGMNASVVVSRGLNIDTKILKDTTLGPSILQTLAVEVTSTLALLTDDLVQQHDFSGITKATSVTELWNFMFSNFKRGFTNNFASRSEFVYDCVGKSAMEMGETASQITCTMSKIIGFASLVGASAAIPLLVPIVLAILAKVMVSYSKGIIYDFIEENRGRIMQTGDFIATLAVNHESLKKGTIGLQPGYHNEYNQDPTTLEILNTLSLNFKTSGNFIRVHYDFPQPKRCERCALSSVGLIMCSTCLFFRCSLCHLSHNCPTWVVPLRKVCLNTTITPPRLTPVETCMLSEHKKVYSIPNNSYYMVVDGVAHFQYVTDEISEVGITLGKDCLYSCKIKPYHSGFHIGEPHCSWTPTNFMQEGRCLEHSIFNRDDEYSQYPRKSCRVCQSSNFKKPQVIPLVSNISDGCCHYMETVFNRWAPAVLDHTYEDTYKLTDYCGLNNKKPLYMVKPVFGTRGDLPVVTHLRHGLFQCDQVLNRGDFCRIKNMESHHLAFHVTYVWNYNHVMTYGYDYGNIEEECGSKYNSNFEGYILRNETLPNIHVAPLNVVDLGVMSFYMDEFYEGIDRTKIRTSDTLTIEPVVEPFLGGFETDTGLTPFLAALREKYEGIMFDDSLFAPTIESCLEFAPQSLTKLSRKTVRGTKKIIRTSPVPPTPSTRTDTPPPGEIPVKPSTPPLSPKTVGGSVGSSIPLPKEEPPCPHHTKAPLKPAVMKKKEKKVKAETTKKRSNFTSRLCASELKSDLTTVLLDPTVSQSSFCLANDGNIRQHHICATTTTGESVKMPSCSTFATTRGDIITPGSRECFVEIAGEKLWVMRVTKPSDYKNLHTVTDGNCGFDAIQKSSGNSILLSDYRNYCISKNLVDPSNQMLASIHCGLNCGGGVFGIEHIISLLNSGRPRVIVGMISGNKLMQPVSVSRCYSSLPPETGDVAIFMNGFHYYAFKMQVEMSHDVRPDIRNYDPPVEFDFTPFENFIDVEEHTVNQPFYESFVENQSHIRAGFVSFESDEGHTHHKNESDGDTKEAPASDGSMPMNDESPTHEAFNDPPQEATTNTSSLDQPGEENYGSGPEETGDCNPTSFGATSEEASATFNPPNEMSVPNSDTQESTYQAPWGDTSVESGLESSCEDDSIDDDVSITSDEDDVIAPDEEPEASPRDEQHVGGPPMQFIPTESELLVGKNKLKRIPQGNEPQIPHVETVSEAKSKPIRKTMTFSQAATSLPGDFPHAPIVTNRNVTGYKLNWVGVKPPVIVLGNKLDNLPTSVASAEGFRVEKVGHRLGFMVDNRRRTIAIYDVIGCESQERGSATFNIFVNGESLSFAGIETDYKFITPDDSFNSYSEEDGYHLTNDRRSLVCVDNKLKIIDNEMFSTGKILAYQLTKNTREFTFGGDIFSGLMNQDGPLYLEPVDDSKILAFKRGMGLTCSPINLPFTPNPQEMVVNSEETRFEMFRRTHISDKIRVKQSNTILNTYNYDDFKRLFDSPSIVKRFKGSDFAYDGKIFDARHHQMMYLNLLEFYFIFKYAWECGTTTHITSEFFVGMGGSGKSHMAIKNYGLMGIMRTRSSANDYANSVTYQTFLDKILCGHVSGECYLDECWMYSLDYIAALQNFKMVTIIGSGDPAQCVGCGTNPDGQQYFTNSLIISKKANLGVCRFYRSWRTGGREANFLYKNIYNNVRWNSVTQNQEVYAIGKRQLEVQQLHKFHGKIQIPPGLVIVMTREEAVGTRVTATASQGSTHPIVNFLGTKVDSSMALVALTRATHTLRLTTQIYKKIFCSFVSSLVQAKWGDYINQGHMDALNQSVYKPETGTDVKGKFTWVCQQIINIEKSIKKKFFINDATPQFGNFKNTALALGLSYDNTYQYKRNSGFNWKEYPTHVEAPDFWITFRRPPNCKDGKVNLILIDAPTSPIDRHPTEHVDYDDLMDFVRETTDENLHFLVKSDRYDNYGLVLTDTTDMRMTWRAEEYYHYISPDTKNLKICAQRAESEGGAIKPIGSIDGYKGKFIANYPLPGIASSTCSKMYELWNSSAGIVWVGTDGRPSACAANITNNIKLLPTTGYKLEKLLCTFHKHTKIPMATEEDKLMVNSLKSYAEACHYVLVGNTLHSVRDGRTVPAHTGEELPLIEIYNQPEHLYGTHSFHDHEESGCGDVMSSGEITHPCRRVVPQVESPFIQEALTRNVGMRVRPRVLREAVKPREASVIKALPKALSFPGLTFESHHNSANNTIVAAGLRLFTPFNHDLRTEHLACNLMWVLHEQCVARGICPGPCMEEDSGSQKIISTKPPNAKREYVRVRDNPKYKPGSWPMITSVMVKVEPLVKTCAIPRCVSVVCKEAQLAQLPDCERATKAIKRLQSSITDGSKEPMGLISTSGMAGEEKAMILTKSAPRRDTDFSSFDSTIGFYFLCFMAAIMTMYSIYQRSLDFWSCFPIKRVKSKVLTGWLLGKMPSGAASTTLSNTYINQFIQLLAAWICCSKILLDLFWVIIATGDDGVNNFTHKLYNFVIELLTKSFGMKLKMNNCSIDDVSYNSSGVTQDVNGTPYMIPTGAMRVYKRFYYKVETHLDTHTDCELVQNFGCISKKLIRQSVYAESFNLKGAPASRKILEKLNAAYGEEKIDLDKWMKKTQNPNKAFHDQPHTADEDKLTSWVSTNWGFNKEHFNDLEKTVGSSDCSNSWHNLFMTKADTNENKYCSISEFGSLSFHIGQLTANVRNVGIHPNLDYHFSKGNRPPSLLSHKREITMPGRKMRADEIFGERRGNELMNLGPKYSDLITMNLK